MQQRNFDHVFQHDNARCHVARVCQDFLNQNHIRVLPWPALSPDMSPIAIEHLWDEFGRRVHHRQNPPEALQELCNTFDLKPKWTRTLPSGILHGIFIKPPPPSFFLLKLTFDTFRWAYGTETHPWN
jgi:hypothetical protein